MGDLLTTLQERLAELGKDLAVFSPVHGATIVQDGLPMLESHTGTEGYKQFVDDLITRIQNFADEMFDDPTVRPTDFPYLNFVYDTPHDDNGVFSINYQITKVST